MASAGKNLTDLTGIRFKKDAFVVIVKTEWNSNTVDRLAAGCEAVLQENAIAFTTLQVPGAFELPFAIKNYRENAAVKADAFIALGCVIRGDTPHFEYVCNAVTNGLMDLNLTMGVPVIFGVLTVNDQQQADERCGGIHGHKGEEAAAAALKMIAISNK